MKCKEVSHNDLFHEENILILSIVRKNMEDDNYFFISPHRVLHIPSSKIWKNISIYSCTRALKDETQFLDNATHSGRTAITLFPSERDNQDANVSIGVSARVSAANINTQQLAGGVK